MNNFAYRNDCSSCNNLNSYIQPVQTFQSPSNLNQQFTNDERFGGAFLVPFLTGAVISAPFWYLGAQNKANQMYQQQMYYQYNNQYPQYYPYTKYYPYNK